MGNSSDAIVGDYDRTRGKWTESGSPSVHCPGGEMKVMVSWNCPYVEEALEI